MTEGKYSLSGEQVREVPLGYCQARWYVENQVLAGRSFHQRIRQPAVTGSDLRNSQPVPGFVPNQSGRKRIAFENGMAEILGDQFAIVNHLNGGSEARFGKPARKPKFVMGDDEVPQRGDQP